VGGAKTPGKVCVAEQRSAARFAEGQSCSNISANK
jgi:hypothetical protein